MKTKSLLLATALLMSTSALAQKNTFKGVVLDDLGEPVIGATVQVKGVKGAGAITDLDGNFVIDADANQTLVITYIGYKDAEIRPSANMKITLKQDDKAITPIILIVVGYSMELAPELISPCLKTILLRVLLQAVMIAGVLMAVKYLVGGSRLLNLAVITYMSSPATFSMQTFLRKKESSAYASTTNSLYCVVSILVYITLAVAG